jgi:hypothetical protein
MALLYVNRRERRVEKSEPALAEPPLRNSLSLARQVVAERSR